MVNVIKQKNVLYKILFIMLVCVVILMVSIIAKASDKQQPTRYYTSVQITHNDTLWSLEEQYNNGVEDSDTYIKNIKKLNNMKEDTINYGSYILMYYY